MNYSLQERIDRAEDIAKNMTISKRHNFDNASREELIGYINSMEHDYRSVVQDYQQVILNIKIDSAPKKDIGYNLNFEIRTNIEMDLDPIIDKILNVVDDENVTYFDLITVTPKNKEIV